MSKTELRREMKPRALPAKATTITADTAEREALSQRFGLTTIHALNAHVELAQDDEAVVANGRLIATVEQPCAVTREDFIYEVDEPIALRFVPASSLPEAAPDEEIELDGERLDEIEYEGETFDLGEAIAQTLGLAIDPYREGPDADAAREQAGIVSDEDVTPSGPLADALAALKRRES